MRVAWLRLCSPRVRPQGLRLHLSLGQDKERRSHGDSHGQPHEPTSHRSRAVLFKPIAQALMDVPAAASSRDETLDWKPLLAEIIA